jgi:hypothetical protein
VFKLEIRTANAAFYDRSSEHDDARALGEEVARILREVAKKIENGSTGAPVHDVNGNNVGRFDLTRD